MNTIIGIVIGMACAVTAYMLGVQTGVRLSKGEQIVHPPRIRRTAKETESERRLRALLNNIDSYDGSGKGQVDIE